MKKIRLTPFFSSLRFRTFQFLGMVCSATLLVLICYTNPTSNLVPTETNAIPNGYWNGYLSQTNVLECANIGEKKGSANVVVTRDDGSILGNIAVTLEIGATTHLILNELRDQNGKGVEDSYGTYRISQDENLISCLPILYKYSQNSNSHLNYALTPPPISKITGGIGGVYNSYDPSITNTGQRYPTYNWLTITNISNSTSTFLVRAYGSLGEALNDEIVSIPPKGRRDVALGHPQGERIGTFTITPESENEYHAFLSRYHQNETGNFDYGFALPLGRSLCGTTLPVSTLNSATEWLHLGNPSQFSASLRMTLYDQSRNPLSQQSFQVSPYATEDIYLNALLDSSGVGAAGLITIECSSDFLTGFIGNYGNVLKTPGSKQWAYVTVPNIWKNSTIQNFITLNTYLSSYNWLVNSNSESLNTIDTTIYSQAGTPLRFSSDNLEQFASKHTPLHEVLGTQAIGLAKIGATSKSDVRLLRVYQGDNGQIDTILSVEPSPPTEIRRVFPKDRSSNQRRIGLTDKIYEKLLSIYRYDSSDVSNRTKSTLVNFQLLREAFDQKLNSTDKDYSSIGGYPFCIKAVSSMGILSALGDDEAFRIAKNALLKAAIPYSIPRMSSAEALPILNDPSMPNASRIIAYNVLGETDPTQPLLNGRDPIYLNTGLESVCLAVGYDWLYSKLSLAERQIVEKSLREVLIWSLSLNEIVFGSDADPVLKHSFLNPVINSGAGLAAIASLDDGNPFNCLEYDLYRPITPREIQTYTFSYLAKQQICRSRQYLDHFWSSFTSSGVFVEGPTNWFVAMEPYTLFRDSLSGVLNDTQLLRNKGVEEKSAIFLESITDTEGDFWSENPIDPFNAMFYNYGDSSSLFPPSSYPFLSAGEVNNNSRIKNFGKQILDQQIRNESASSDKEHSWINHGYDWSRAFSLLLNPEGDLVKSPTQPLMILNGSNHRFDFARMEANSSSGKWVVRQKGGTIEENHSHHDSGSFVLDIGGIRWFSDLGPDYPSSGYYNDYFNIPSDPIYEKGLKFFRKNSLSHNLVTLNGDAVTTKERALNFASKARIIDFAEQNSTDGSGVLETTWDTSTLYNYISLDSTRKMRLTSTSGNNSLSIYDKLDFRNLPTDLKKPMATWHAVHCIPQQAGWQGSSKVISIGGKPGAELSLTSPNNVTKKLNIIVDSPLNANIEITSANPNSNQSIKKSETYQVENSNAGCSLISVVVKGSDLEKISKNVFRANFEVVFNTPN